MIKMFPNINKQLSLASKTKNRIWSKVVMAKIRNQAKCVEQTGHSRNDVGLIQSISSNITEGDKHNVEAYAAREYFPMMFGKNFKRGRFDEIINADLNYGYAFLRALIRREVQSQDTRDRLIEILRNEIPAAG
ncbi:CRISPR-associated protein Cas1 [Ligilactobacillus ruminis S23]|nr:CRISPR-associated protein Cas1 [Ligilactobacillus ruminis S23]